MSKRYSFSLIVPTRQRPAQLRTFLDSVAASVRHPLDVEVVLVVDADDSSNAAVHHSALAIRRVIVAPGQTMGALNRSGSEAARGDFVMLLNDDVVVRTPGWDARIRACLRRFPDDVVLVHVNDTLFRDRLCTFPMVSRNFCNLAGGICPSDYARYRIDDHIEDVFNLLGALGKRRSVYLPDVVFEHHNTVEHPTAGAVYAADPRVLALDDARFSAHADDRKELALRLLEHIEGFVSPAVRAERRRLLTTLNDPFLLRTPGRQRVDCSARLRYAAAILSQPGSLANWMNAWLERARTYVWRRGFRSTVAAAACRLGRWGQGLGSRELKQAAHEARYPARDFEQAI